MSLERITNNFIKNNSPNDIPSTGSPLSKLGGAVT